MEILWEIFFSIETSVLLDQDKLTDKGSEDLFTSDAPPLPLPVDYKETDRQFYALYDFQGTVRSNQTQTQLHHTLLLSH